MPTQFFGAKIPRREDDRLVLGQGRFIDDITLPNSLFVVLYRSPYAHARIRRIATEACQQIEGVIAVITADELGQAARPFPQILPHDGLTSRTWLALAKDKVRFVGEPVAAVIATSRQAATEALDVIEVDYDILEAIVDVESAVAAGAPLVHDDAPGNIAVRFEHGFGKVDRALSSAQHQLRERFQVRRAAGQPLEPRGVIANYDAVSGQLTVWSSTQEPHTVRDTIVDLLDLRRDDVRVITPDTGGGFGTKLNVYPEEVLIPWLARRFQRPVKWIETRSEHMLAATQEREQIHDVEFGFDGDGRILAIKDRFLHDSGAYTPRGGAAPLITSSAIPGPYKVPNYHCAFQAVYTHTATVSVYRGAGQPQAVFVMERIMDRIAQHLGLDPIEVRTRNLIAADEFPYDTGLRSFIGTPTLYDSGDYHGMLRLTVDAAQYDTLRQEQTRAREAGRLFGIGVACYVELTGRGPWEGATVRVEPDGSITVHTGAPSQGQGHETSFAQICADALGVPMAAVNIIGGDTAGIPHGIGTFASRAGVLAGNAIFAAANEIRRKVLGIAESLLNTPSAQIQIVDGWVGSLTNADNRVSLAEIAQAAQRKIHPGETSPGLEATHYFHVPQMTYANGVHIAAVEVDADTGEVRILKYVVGHDCGTVINPTIVEGQVKGGVACGIGNALLERHVYDDDGQLLTGSFMDYAMPRCTDMPELIIVHQETPSKVNPLGVKGAGEAGTIPVAAVVCSAVEDALAPLGLRLNRVPILQPDLWQLIKNSPTQA